MIQVSQTSAPAGFQTNCAGPGAAWLQTYPDKDPHENAIWWQAYKDHLAEAFHHRCGYLAMFITDGHMDHFLACGHREGKQSPHRDHAFEWPNFRYADGPTNVRKGTLDDQILDPFEIRADWFEVDLCSFLIRATDIIPDDVLKEKALKTIDELCLNTDRRIRFLRRHFYECYWDNPTPKAFARLEKEAPLIAAAIQKRLQAGLPLPDPTLYPVPLNEVPVRQRAYAPRFSRTRNP